MPENLRSVCGIFPLSAREAAGDCDDDAGHDDAAPIQSS
jgi:hypothetical protein